MASERLDPLGPGFVATRESLHRVAEQLITPARKPDNEIALKATPGGFGTPVFEFEREQWQVRVEGGELVVRRGGEEKRGPITTLAAGAELLGPVLLPGGPTETEPLTVKEAEARRLGAWFVLGDAVLGELRTDWANDAPSEVNLWPEHFDIAIEAGVEAAGRRANYGFSPGDAQHDEPYLYVGPWSAEVSGELWNAEAFSGAELSYSELSAAPEPRAAALEFCRVREQALSQTST